MEEVQFMNKPYEIQPLRLQGGWTVECNNFYECEPDNSNDFGTYFVEDLLQLTNSKYNLVLDLGFLSKVSIRIIQKTTDNNSFH